MNAALADSILIMMKRTGVEVAIFPPAGLVICEGVGAAILTPAVGAEVALLGSVPLRGITAVVDLSLTLLSMTAGTRSQATK